MISRNLFISLHFLTISIVKQTDERIDIENLKFLFSILERTNDIKFVMISYDNRKL